MVGYRLSTSSRGSAARALAGSVVVLALVPVDARAAPGAGTLADPVRVDAFPYVAADTTATAPASAVDSYDCAPALDESGPERLYRFALAAPARVTAWVEGDGGAVDIDVHLIAGAIGTSGGQVTGCVARGNVIAEAELPAGEGWVAVDSYAGAAQAGPYVLHLEAIGDAWIDRPIAVGVRWRARRYVDWAGPQVVNELVVDTSQPDVSVRAVGATGCQTVGALGDALGAVAGVNGGYFGAGCAPVSLLIEDGVLVATNGVTRGAYGLDAAGGPHIEVVAAGAGWPVATQAHGGGPVLVVGDTPYQGAAAWSAQGFSSAGFNGNNPRTTAGYDASGASHFLAVDGRRANASGMSLDELAAFTHAELGLPEVVNLDGGGSTTLWIAGATPNGVVNYPSDDPQQELATHPGSRGVSGGFYVFAPPYNHPPRFQTAPVESATAGVPYGYDADAIDLDPDDVVSFELDAGPAGMEVDAASGVVTYAPTSASPPSADVTLVARDDRGAATEQSYVLVIAGGLGGGGGGGAGGAAGQGGAAVPADPADEPSPGAGCACRASGAGARAPRASLGASALSAVAALGLLALGRARARRACSRSARRRDRP
ncbi:MAG: phosphodiester glycosidase family protein [Myxococcales bacterium]|nr:phosphodiester glycosidase family protein [Myxococcales bacterium]